MRGREERTAWIVSMFSFYLLSSCIDSTFYPTIYPYLHHFPSMFTRSLFLCSWKHLCCCFRWKKRNKNKGNEVYALMEKQYTALGPISYVPRFNNIKVSLNYELIECII